MNISPNFKLEEFEIDGPMPLECRQAYIELANEVLEPAHGYAKRTFPVCLMKITSGWRPPEANAAAHGQKDSEHMATADRAAADFLIPGVAMRALFDWMRMNPELPFHQLILEHGKNSTVIHVSWNRLKPGVRSVLEGAEHNAEPYVAVDHVGYKPLLPVLHPDLSSE